MTQFKKAVRVSALAVFGTTAFGFSPPAFATSLTQIPTDAWSEANLSDLSCAIRMMALNVYATEASEQPGISERDRDDHLGWARIYNTSFHFYIGRLSAHFSPEQLAAKAPEEFEKIKLQSDIEQDDSNGLCLENSAEFEEDFITNLRRPNSK